MRVMIVSEDAAVRTRTGAALAAREHIEVVEATSADDAHRRLPTADIDVVVMDGDMRPEGGYSVIYEMRAAAQLRDVASTPTVVLMDRPQDRWLARWAGADQALMKPVNPFELADVIGELHERDARAPDDPGATTGRRLEMDDPPEMEATVPSG